VQVVADSAYAGQALRELPAAISWTTRLRANAALSELAPPRTSKPGSAPAQGGTAARPENTRRRRHLHPDHGAPLGATVQV